MTDPEKLPFEKIVYGSGQHKAGIRAYRVAVAAEILSHLDSAHIEFEDAELNQIIKAAKAPDMAFDFYDSVSPVLVINQEKFDRDHLALSQRVLDKINDVTGHKIPQAIQADIMSKMSSYSGTVLSRHFQEYYLGIPLERAP